MEAKKAAQAGKNNLQETSAGSTALRTTDRRVRKTKASLRHCLAELMKKKKINEITVKELADMSDLNRGTFYLHYRDVYDLLEQTEDELIQEFNGLLNKYDPSEIRTCPSKIFSEIFSLVYENRDIVGILLGENGDVHFLNHLKEILRERCLNDLMEDYRDKNPQIFTIYFQFILSGCIGIVQYWIRSGCKESPRELAEITEQILREGLSILDQS